MPCCREDVGQINKEKLEKMARKAKMASQKPLKVLEAPAPTEDEEDTWSGLVFP